MNRITSKIIIGSKLFDFYINGKNIMIGGGLFGFYRGYTTCKIHIINERFSQPSDSDSDSDLDEDEHLDCLITGVGCGVLYTVFLPFAIIFECNHLYYNIIKNKNKK